MTFIIVDDPYTETAPENAERVKFWYETVFHSKEGTVKDRRVQAAVFAILGGILGAFPYTWGALIGIVVGALLGWFYVLRTWCKYEDSFVNELYKRQARSREQ